MAKRITAFAAADGTLFTDPAACATYEKTTLLAVGVGAALTALGAAGNNLVIANVEGGIPISLQDFLIQNSEVLIEALSPVKAPRKAREPKAPAPTVITTGGDIAPIVIKEEPVVTPEVVVTEANVAAGSSAEAELEALLGSGTAETGEVAL